MSAMTQDDWQLYLTHGESVKWNGQSQFVYLKKGFIFFIIYSFLFALLFLYFALKYESLYDACGPHLRRSCRQLYHFYWPGTTIMGFCALSFLYQLISHANGTAKNYYAITNLRILKLTTPLYLLSGRKLSQVECKGLSIEVEDTALIFRSEKRKVMVFFGLSILEVLQARDACNCEKTMRLMP